MKPSRMPAVRQAKYSGKNTVTMKMDMGAVNAAIRQLEGDIQKATRPAAQAAAEVLYQAVLKNVDAIGSVTGNLRASIYQAFSNDKSKEGENGGYSRATYHVSWNAKRAPHGHLVEHGHIQRYAVRQDENGNWFTLVRPEMRGKPRPKRGASQAAKDAYYVLRPGGPVQIAARPFVRPAFYQQAAAADAAQAVLLAQLGAK